jgi:hypothetical protein
MPTHAIHSRPVPSAQETNLQSVGGTEDDPTSVSSDQVLGWVGMGFDVFSTVLGTVQAIEGGELAGSEGSATPANAGTLAITDPATGDTAYVAVRELWIPIGIGATVLVGLLIWAVASR